MEVARGNDSDDGRLHEVTLFLECNVHLCGVFVFCVLLVDFKLYKPELNISNLTPCRLLSIHTKDGFMNVFKAVPALCIAFLLAACSSPSSSNTPGSPGFNYSGSWSGSIVDSVAGSGSINASMSQSGNTLRGTWSATFAQGSNGGSLVGEVNGSSVVINLVPSNTSSCPYNVVANRNGSSLAGNYAAYDCSQTVTGSLDIQK